MNSSTRNKIPQIKTKQKLSMRDMVIDECKKFISLSIYLAPFVLFEGVRRFGVLLFLGVFFLPNFFFGVFFFGVFLPPYTCSNNAANNLILLFPPGLQPIVDLLQLQTPLAIC